MARFCGTPLVTRLAALTLAVAIALSMPAQADPGARIGAPAPALVGVDQHGTPRSLGEWTGKGPVAVLFYRSGDW